VLTRCAVLPDERSSARGTPLYEHTFTRVEVMVPCAQCQLSDTSSFVEAIASTLEFSDDRRRSGSLNRTMQPSTVVAYPPDGSDM
jgi:hypothetical protein